MDVAPDHSQTMSCRTEVIFPPDVQVISACPFILLKKIFFV